MKPKVLFVRNRLVDYIIPWLNLVSKDINLTVLITRDDNEFQKYMKEVSFNVEHFSYIKLFNKFGISLPLIPRLLKGDYDIIVSSDLHTFETYISFFISKLKGKRYIPWNETFEWPRARRSKLLNPLIRKVARESDAAMVVGQKAKEYLINLGAEERKIFITPYTTLKYSVNISHVNVPKNKQVILYLSRIVRYKGLDYLVKAFSKLEKERNDVFLLICGDGPFKQEIKSLINELKIKNFHFEEGHVPSEKKGFYYSIADVFVLPSTFRDHDADCWGLVLNEAMSFGKPVVSTDAAGGAHDLIKQGINGYMVKQKDSEELYKALNKILSNKKLKYKMCRESKKIIESFHTYEKMSKGFVDAVNYAISS